MLENSTSPISFPPYPNITFVRANTRRIRVKREDKIERLEKETANGNYQHLLTQEDIADIARIEYENYEKDKDNIFSGFEIVGNVRTLKILIRDFQKNIKDKAKFTIIINLNNVHWVTLVLFYQDSRLTHAYYMDSKPSIGNSLGSSDYKKFIEDEFGENKLIDLSSYFGFEQQLLLDTYNCGLWALENAADINWMLENSKRLDKLIEKLNIQRDESYFQERRRYFSRKLRVDPVRQGRLQTSVSGNSELKKDGLENIQPKQSIERDSRVPRARKTSAQSEHPNPKKPRVDTESSNVEEVIQQPGPSQAETSKSGFSSPARKKPKLETSNPGEGIQQPETQRNGDKIKPYPHELKWDSKLKLEYYEEHVKAFKESSTSSEFPIRGENWLTEDIYPADHELGLLSKLVYKKDVGFTMLNKPEFPELEGWQLLAKAFNPSSTNGYVGALYGQTEKKQLVIAHRGTDPRNFGADWTDIKGIFGGNYVAQMNSASTFSHRVIKEFLVSNPNIRISFTGHSLGGWLAQITTFTAEYLEQQPSGNYFQKRDKFIYHPHTVVFDSPGCKPMLSKLKQDFDRRYKKNILSIQALDIKSYLSAPNQINTCNHHTGVIYRVFPKLNSVPNEEDSWSRNWFSRLTEWMESYIKYTLKTHNLDRIIKALPKINKKCKRCK